MVLSVHVVLILFYHRNNIFYDGYFNLINHDFIYVQDRISYQSRGFHLVYVHVTMVIWRDLVLQTVG